MLGALAGCGSGGAGGSPASAAAAGTGATGTTTVTAPAASIQLLASSTTIPSSGAGTVDLTAIVLSSTKQAINGKTVIFSTGTDSSAFINNVSTSGTSDPNGLVTAKLNLGADKSNRTITVSASADTVSATNTVDVTGTTLAVSGANSLVSGATTSLLVSLKDSAGTAIPGATVTVTSKNGNAITLTPATGVTNSQGQITADVKATAAGANDVITVSANGVSATQALTISPDSFAFTTPAADIDIPLGTAKAISITWTNSTTPIAAGTKVNFAASRGTIGTPAGGAVTTAVGDTPGVTIVSANTAGPAIITATGASGTPAATLNVNFVATSASNVTAQAVPGVVAFTTGSASQTNNSSTISVVVRDSKNNLVKNAAVNFTITADPSNGRLTSSSVVTDNSGSASVTYVAGGTSSALGGVAISATVTSVNGTAVAVPAATTTLTVAGQASLVRIGTDNLVGIVVGTPVYTKTWVANVTDTANNPVPGVTVRFNLRPTRFAKGQFVYNTVAGFWIQPTPPYIRCLNEDTDFDGILKTGEDTNGNGMLDPGGAASVTGSAVTDATGNAVALITYPKDHAYWAEYSLEARTGVTGNDPPTASLAFWLPGLASDYSSAATAPPGQYSPYGVNNTTPALGAVSAGCTDTN